MQSLSVPGAGVLGLRGVASCLGLATPMAQGHQGHGPVFCRVDTAIAVATAFVGPSGHSFLFISIPEGEIGFYGAGTSDQVQLGCIRAAPLSQPACAPGTAPGYFEPQSKSG